MPSIYDIPPPPGARLVIRDEEWVVRSTDRSHHGYILLNVTGVSPLVRRPGMDLHAREG